MPDRVRHGGRQSGGFLHAASRARSAGSRRFNRMVLHIHDLRSSLARAACAAGISASIATVFRQPPAPLSRAGAPGSTVFRYAPRRWWECSSAMGFAIASTPDSATRSIPNHANGQLPNEELTIPNGRLPNLKLPTPNWQLRVELVGNWPLEVGRLVSWRLAVGVIGRYRSRSRRA
jgi:hypothetical protein